MKALTPDRLDGFAAAIRWLLRRHGDLWCIAGEVSPWRVRVVVAGDVPDGKLREIMTWFLGAGLGVDVEVATVRACSS